MEKFPVMSRWKVTAAGYAISPPPDGAEEGEGVIGKPNAEEFATGPHAHAPDTPIPQWTLNCQFLSQPSGILGLQFFRDDKSQTVDRIRLPLTKMQLYLRNKWIKRVDIESMELEYPLNSAWKLTEAGFRNIDSEAGSKLKHEGPVTWIITQLNILPGPPVKQLVTFWNKTLWDRENERENTRKVITVNIESVQSWQVKRYIERINIDVMLVDDNQFLITQRRL